MSVPYVAANEAAVWQQRFSLLDGGGFDANPREQAHQILLDAAHCAQSRDYQGLYEITQFGLPYLLQHAPEPEFTACCRKVVPVLLEDDDAVSATQWLQYGAILLRKARKHLSSLRVTESALQLSRKEGLVIQEAYLLLNAAAVYTALQRYQESVSIIGEAKSVASQVGEDFSFLAQAELEMAKLHIKLEQGELAAGFADGASDFFKGQCRMAFANGLLQGYQALAYLYSGKEGHAYAFGLRSIVSLVLEQHIPALREFSRSMLSDALQDVYGFSEERELVYFLSEVGNPQDRLPSRNHVNRAQIAASKLYLFHLEYCAQPNEYYENPLRASCYALTH